MTLAWISLVVIVVSILSFLIVAVRRARIGVWIAVSDPRYMSRGRTCSIDGQLFIVTAIKDERIRVRRLYRLRRDT